MSSSLYRKDNYLNKTITAIESNYIYEYDMKSAGFNILKSLGLLKEDEINYLSGLEKKHRQIVIGKMLKKDKDMNKALNSGFKEYRKRFFEANNIQDKDVLSIKKDAIFLINKPAKHLQFDEVIFDKKNKYTSYLYINKKEIYYNSKTIDVKGISDKRIKKHKNGFLLFFKNLFKLMENSDKEHIRTYIRDFSNKYRHMELPLEYYREFTSESMYRYNYNILGSGLGTYTNVDIDIININYNYINYILPLVKIFF